jgi:hypothetical protein
MQLKWHRHAPTPNNLKVPTKRMLEYVYKYFFLRHSQSVLSSSKVFVCKILKGFATDKNFDENLPNSLMNILDKKSAKYPPLSQSVVHLWYRIRDQDISRI